MKLFTWDICKSIQENLKSVVTDGKLNDVIILHALDIKDKHIWTDPNRLQVTFKDIKKFDAQNPIIGKVLTQIETSKLSDKKIKEQLGQLKDREIEARLSNLRRNINFNNKYNHNNNNSLVGGQLVTYLDHHLRRLRQELRMDLLIHLLAQQRRYCQCWSAPPY